MRHTKPDRVRTDHIHHRWLGRSTSMLLLLMICVAFGDAAEPEPTRTRRMLWIGNYLLSMGRVPLYTDLLLRHHDPGCQAIHEYAGTVHGGVAESWEKQIGVFLLRPTAGIPEKDSRGRTYWGPRLEALQRFKAAPVDWVILQVGLPMAAKHVETEEPAIRKYMAACQEAKVPIALMEPGLSAALGIGRALEKDAEGGLQKYLDDSKTKTRLKELRLQERLWGVPVIPGTIAYVEFMRTHPQFHLARRDDNHYSQETGYFMACLVTAYLYEGRPATFPDEEAVFGEHNARRESQGRQGQGGWPETAGQASLQVRRVPAG